MNLEREQQQVGDDGTVDERHQNAGQGRDRVAKTVKAVDQKEKDDAQGDRSEPGQHPVKIGLDVRLFVHHVINSVPAAGSRNTHDTC